MFYLVDTENVTYLGFEGIEKLTAADRLIIFYTENSRNISFDTHRKLLSTEAETEYFKVRAGGKNALDFQLSTYLGGLVATDPDGEYCIISNNTGFDFVTGFWTEHGAKVFRSPNMTREHRAVRTQAPAPAVSEAPAQEPAHTDAPAAEAAPAVAETKADAPVPQAAPAAEPAKENKEPEQAAPAESDDIPAPALAASAQTLEASGHPVIAGEDAPVFVSPAPKTNTPGYRPHFSAKPYDRITDVSFPKDAAQKAPEAAKPAAEPAPAAQPVQTSQPASASQTETPAPSAAKKAPSRRRRTSASAKKAADDKKTAETQPSDAAKPAAADKKPAQPAVSAADSLAKILTDGSYDIAAIAEIVDRYKTKESINNALVKKFGQDKGHDIYVKIKSLLKNKN